MSDAVKTLKDLQLNLSALFYPQEVGLRDKYAEAIREVLAENEELREDVSSFRRLLMEYGWDSVGNPREWLKAKMAEVERLRTENVTMKALPAEKVRAELAARIEAALARAACREDDEHDGVTLAAVVKALRGEVER